MSQRLSPPRRKRLQRIPERGLRIAAYAILTLWSCVCLFPLYWLAITSFKSEADIIGQPRYLPFVDFTPAYGAWSFILTDANDNLVMRFVNSTVVGLTATVLTVLFGAMAVYGMTRYRLPGPWTHLSSAILATRLLPPVVIVLPAYLLALLTGLLDTWLALIVTYTALNLPVAVWLLQPVFGTGVTAQEEAAQLDGASQIGIFFTIFLPMIATSIAAVSLLIFVLCWNEYLFAAYLAGDHAMTLPPWMVGQMSIKEAQVGSEAEEWANFSAATMLMAVPLLAGAAVLQGLLGRMGTWRA
jgi:multiple sugar transport system permease protein